MKMNLCHAWRSGCDSRRKNAIARSTKIGHTILAVLALLFLGALSANANLIQKSDPRFGANSLIDDTRTGLVWLYLPASLDLSYSQAEADMVPGGEFAGFRHATAEGVLSLYNSAGFGEGFFGPSSPDYQNVTALISLMDPTNSAGASGITGTFEPGASDAVAMAYIGVGYSGGGQGFFVTASLGSPGTTSTDYGLGTAFPDVGNWMVVVPEPSSLALTIAGGAFLVALFKRRT